MAVDYSKRNLLTLCTIDGDLAHAESDCLRNEGKKFSVTGLCFYYRSSTNHCDWVEPEVVEEAAQNLKIL